MRWITKAFLVVVALLWMSPHVFAADPFLTESKVQLDIEGMLSRLFQRHQFFVQVNGQVVTRSERRVVEGETFQDSVIQEETPQVIMMPGFLPEPILKGKETKTPQQRQVYRIIDIPELKMVRVHVNLHDKLPTEIVSQAKVSGDKRIGDEIGIHPVTIYGWRRRQRVRVKRPRFQRVAIAAPEVSEPRLVVEGPRGLKFLGLTISDAAKLVREVAHEF